MNTPERFSLAEAAKILRISVPTARRMVFKGHLSAVKVMIGEKIRWEIECDEVFTLQARSLQLQSEGFTPKALPELTKVVNPDLLNASAKASEEEAFRDSMKPGLKPSVNASLKASDLVKLTSNASLNASEPGVPLTAHLAALELASKQIDRLNEKAERLQTRAEQADRLRIAMEYQLLQYQAALSDQAESLAQERAVRMTLEAKQTEPLQVELETLKMDTPTAAKSWGHRVKRWLGIRTGT